MADNRIPSFLIGLGLGATFGLLVAPSRGDKTREDLRKAAKDGQDLVQEGLGRGPQVRRSRDRLEQGTGGVPAGESGIRLPSGHGCVSERSRQALAAACA